LPPRTAHPFLQDVRSGSLNPQCARLLLSKFFFPEDSLTQLFYLFLRCLSVGLIASLVPFLPVRASLARETFNGSSVTPIVFLPLSMDLAPPLSLSLGGLEEKHETWSLLSVYPTWATFCSRFRSAPPRSFSHSSSNAPSFFSWSRYHYFSARDLLSSSLK